MLFLEFFLPIVFWFVALGIGITVWVVDRQARRQRSGAPRRETNDGEGAP